jgi:hypothetical protein
MKVTEQGDDKISFRAQSGASGKTIPLGWHRDLRDTSRQNFSGRLTGDAFDSSFIELQFYERHTIPITTVR